MSRPPEHLRIESVEDAQKIIDLPVRGFVTFLKQRRDHLKITYEPEKFESNTNGRHRETTPDLLIVNPNNISSPGKIVEITAAPKNGHNGDPKQKQKGVMQDACPEIHYTVLYLQNLRNIEERFGVEIVPELSDSNGQRMENGNGHH